MPSRAEIRGVLTGLAAVVALLVIGATIWPLLPGQPLLQTLRFHLAGLGLAFAVLLVVFGGHWRGAGLALMVLASIGQGAWLVYEQQQARVPLVARESVATLDLISFNLLTDNRQGAEIAEMLLRRQADVVYIMEGAPLFDHLDALAALYPYRAGCENEATCDLMMLSRTPLETVQVASLSDFSRNRLITARTSIEGALINLVALHLTKPYFDMQAEGETWRLRRHLEALEGPVVLGGDFNAAPWSYNLVRLARDQVLAPAPWYPATWPTEFGPLGVPIDNLFTQGAAVIETIEGLASTYGSNHRGLAARIAILR